MRGPISQRDDRSGRRPYVLYSPPPRRRRVAWLVLTAVVLIAAAFAWPMVSDLRIPRPGDAAAWKRGELGKRDATRAARSEDGALGTEDGYVPVDGSLSPYSDQPAVANLDSGLREALHRAAEDAGAAGITLRVNGGWRSAEYQQELLRRAVETYGSVEAASQYALPPEESKHVSGEALDVGPSEAAAWLSQHGSEYGLCQIYANEPWHFELATEPGGTCPRMSSNAAEG